MQLPESIELKVYYDEKSKKCFAKTILTVWLPGDKLKTFIGKGDTIKHTDDIENKKFGEVLASVRSNRDALRQYEDYLLMYSHRFAKNVKPKLAKKVVLNETEFTKAIKNKGINSMLDLIGGMANPIFTKGMMNK
jgi:hypothetical protein